MIWNEYADVAITFRCKRVARRRYFDCITPNDDQIRSLTDPLIEICPLPCSWSLNYSVDPNRRDRLISIEDKRVEYTLTELG